MQSLTLCFISRGVDKEYATMFLWVAVIFPHGSCRDESVLLHHDYHLGQARLNLNPMNFGHRDLREATESDKRICSLHKRTGRRNININFRSQIHRTASIKAARQYYDSLTTCNTSVTRTEPSARIFHNKNNAQAA